MDLINLAKQQWDRTAAIVLTVIGGIALIGGWVGVSGTPVLAEQTRYIVSGGIAAIFFLGLGASLWISADLRDEWRKLDRIEESLGNGVLRWDPAGAGAPGTVDLTVGETDPSRLQVAEAGQNGHSRKLTPPGQVRVATPAHPNG
jgi:hypothetical protein